jgi:purine-binding chemotaxis protein CheW
MKATAPAADAAATHPLAGEYLAFRLGGERFALPILTVQEIIGRLPITPVPGAASAMRGVINLRGKVIPVMDLRARLGMSPLEEKAHTVIIVVQAVIAGAGVTVGLQVDEALEVATFGAGQVSPPPPVSSEGVEGDLVRGVAQAGEHLTFLLDLDRIIEPLHPATGGQRQEVAS